MKIGVARVLIAGNERNFIGKVFDMKNLGLVSEEAEKQ
jgi:hypothetical protein